MTLLNGLCLCNGGKHTGIITNKKVEFNFKVINELISVCHMTEKVSGAYKCKRILNIPPILIKRPVKINFPC